MSSAWVASVIQSSVFLLLAATALRTCLGTERFVFGGVALVLIPGCALAGISLVAENTVYPFQSQVSVLYWSSLCGVFLTSLQVLQDPVMRSRFRTALMVFGSVMAIAGLVHFHTSAGRFLWIWETGYPDTFGTFPNRNHFAAFIELVIPVTLWRAIHDRAHRGVCLGLTAGMISAVVASASRAGAALVLLEVIAVVAIAFAQHRVRRSELVPIAGLTAVFTLAASAIAGWNLLWRRLDLSDAWIYRREIYQSTLEMLEARPWTGFGPGTFSTVYPAYAHFDSGGFVNFAHSDWLQSTVEGGIPMFMCLLCIFGLTLVPAIRSGWGIGVVFVFLHSIVDFPLQRIGVAGWQFAMMAAALAARPRRRPSKSMSRSARITYPLKADSAKRQSSTTAAH